MAVLVVRGMQGMKLTSKRYAGQSRAGCEELLQLQSWELSQDGFERSFHFLLHNLSCMRVYR